MNKEELIAGGHELQVDVPVRPHTAAEKMLVPVHQVMREPGGGWYDISTEEMATLKRRPDIFSFEFRTLYRGWE